MLDEDSASTDTTFTHDAEGDQGGSLKGNLIDDGHFVYVYDAWHRLVKTRSSNTERDQ